MSAPLNSGTNHTAFGIDDEVDDLIAIFRLRKSVLNQANGIGNIEITKVKQTIDLPYGLYVLLRKTTAVETHSV